MPREEKIKAIYKEMANKELSPWCCVEVKAQNEYGDFTYRLCRWDERPEEEIKEVIWHPVMIWDVIKRIKENIEISYWEHLVKLLGQLSRPWLWRELGLSIDDQSQECIDYVYSLIQKN